MQDGSGHKMPPGFPGPVFSQSTGRPREPHMVMWEQDTREQVPGHKQKTRGRVTSREGSTHHSGTGRSPEKYRCPHQNQETGVRGWSRAGCF